MKRFFTSESVTEGHPDKVADQISDSILDAILSQDPHARVACEVMVNTGLVFISGEITTDCYVDISQIARERIRKIGYTADMGFDADSVAVMTSIDEQSPDIAMGVNDTEKHIQGAGDQGMMFGYATNETPEYMPLPITVAHALARRLAQVRREGIVSYLRPDGKVQVTFEYDSDWKPVRIDTLVLSTQHEESVTHDQIERDMRQYVLNPIAEQWIDDATVYHVNPTGKFVLGGPQADCGLTGRKIIVDTYGGMARHGGGAFSGKDPSKVDRSGAYMARFIAKNIVANTLADRAEVQLSYAIGIAEPVSIFVETFGTSSHSNAELEAWIREHFDLTPKGIISQLNLLQPIYAQTAAYGHFGRSDLDLPWERILQLPI